MSSIRLLLVTMSLLLGMAWSTAHAAQSYDNCTGVINSLPAVITTAGTWCLKKDLNTAMTSGNAIDIQTNNVTIDCNDFKLGGLAAGLGTQTSGIYALQRSNLTVRHCNIRGFVAGINFDSLGNVGGGQIIEDNRLDGNTAVGIRVEGDGSVVRRNQVLNTGGSTLLFFANGIVTYYSVDVLDNTVFGVTTATGSNGNARGIFTQSDDAGDPGESIDGNRIRSVVADGTGIATGILAAQPGVVVIRGNDLIGVSQAGSIGLNCSNGISSARDNVVIHFSTPITNCADSFNSTP